MFAFKSSEIGFACLDECSKDMKFRFKEELNFQGSLLRHQFPFFYSRLILFQRLFGTNIINGELMNLQIAC